MDEQEQVELKDYCNAVIGDKSYVTGSSQLAKKIIALLDENAALKANLLATQNVRDRAIESVDKLEQQNARLLAMLKRMDSVVLTVKQADALLNDDGNDNQAAVDEVERQLAAKIARERK